MSARRLRRNRPDTLDDPLLARNWRAHYGWLALFCFGTALAIACLIAWFSPPPEPDASQASLAPVRSPPPSPSITLPRTAEQASAESMQRELTALIEELESRFPQLCGALHVAAVAYIDLHNTAKAEQLWRKCIELAPEYLGPHVGLANVAMDRGDDQAAVEILEKALAAGYSSPELYHQFGEALTRIGQLDRAEEVLQQGAEAYPASAPLWRLLGQTKMQLGKLAEAEASFERALDLGERSPDLYFALAGVSARLDKSEAAAEYRAKFTAAKSAAADAGPDSFDSRYAAAVRQTLMRSLQGAAAVYARQNDLPRAEQLSLRALALDPDDTVALRELSQIYRSQGRLADMLEAQQRLVEIDPESAYDHINLASVAAELGDYSKAEKALKEAIRLRPDLALPYLSLARLRLNQGDFSQARLFAEGAVRREPSPDGYAMLAAACEALGDTRAAESARKAAAKLSSPATSTPRDSSSSPSQPTVETPP